MTEPSLDLGAASHMAIVVNDLASAMWFYSSTFETTRGSPISSHRTDDRSQIQSLTRR